MPPSFINIINAHFCGVISKLWNNMYSIIYVLLLYEGESK